MSPQESYQVYGEPKSVANWLRKKFLGIGASVLRYPGTQKLQPLQAAGVSLADSQGVLPAQQMGTLDQGQADDEKPTPANEAGSSPAPDKSHLTKLNLGCGFDLREGYLNVDFQAFHKPDLVADIRNLEMLASDSYDEILAQDCLEHFPRCDTMPALLEWARLLKPGGKLFLRVPDLIGLLKVMTWPSMQSVKSQETLVQCLFGTQAYDGDWHLAGFTKRLIKHYLKQAGFEKIKFKSVDHWLFDISCVKK